MLSILCYREAAKVIFLLYIILSPWIFYFILDKNTYSLKAKFGVSMALFLVVMVLLFFMRELLLEYAMRRCFDYPVIVLKEGAPACCSQLDIASYQGIGWPLKVFFLTASEFFYAATVFLGIKYYQSK